MMKNLKGRLNFQRTELGFVKTEDDSLIITRVAVIDIKPAERSGPFGPEFNINFTVGVAVHPSEKIREEIRGKPLLEPGKTVDEGWIRVEILEKYNAYEEVVYKDQTLGEYLIRVEIEPIMVAKNTLYKLLDDMPYYVVRWIPKISYKKIADKSG
jgi:hypothetical protein